VSGVAGWSSSWGTDESAPILTNLMKSPADCREQWEIDFERDALESHREKMRRGTPRAERARRIRESADRAGVVGECDR